MLKLGAERILSYASQVPTGASPAVVDLVRAGTRVAVRADTFGMSEVTVYNWLKQDRIDRCEEIAKTTDQQIELAAAKRRITQLETELAVGRKVNEVFLAEGISPKGSTR